MKLHPPGPSRVRAQRHREGLAECVALAEDWESGKPGGSDGLGIGHLLCQGQRARRKTTACALTVGLCSCGMWGELRGPPVWQGQAGLCSAHPGSVFSSGTWVGFSVQGAVSWETSKAPAERDVSQQQLQSSVCGFCRTAVLRLVPSRSVLQGLERLCLAQRGAAVAQLWLQPVQGFAKARGPARSLHTDTSLRCGSCPSLDTDKEGSVG